MPKGSWDQGDLERAHRKGLMTQAQAARADRGEITALADGQSVREKSPEGTDLAASLYLDLMKKCLTRVLFPEQSQSLFPRKSRMGRVTWRWAQSLLAHFDINLVQTGAVNLEARLEGVDWPAGAETMIGLKRLNNLEDCISDVLRSEVPGDLIETGVWRGGATIFMRAVLKAYQKKDRVVWVADSFQGLPKPNARKYPADAGDKLWRTKQLAVPLEDVQESFRRYGLLDDQVQFLPGWFRDTLPTVPIERLAILRLDGDLYESTMDALTHLYPKLSPGGYAIIDDYALPPCQAAVDEYRKQHQITEPMVRVDQFAQFWQRRR